MLWEASLAISLESKIGLVEPLLSPVPAGRGWTLSQAIERLKTSFVFYLRTKVPVGDILQQLTQTQTQDPACPPETDTPYTWQFRHLRTTVHVTLTVRYLGKKEGENAGDGDTPATADWVIETFAHVGVPNANGITEIYNPIRWGSKVTFTTDSRGRLLNLTVPGLSSLRDTNNTRRVVEDELAWGGVVRRLGLSDNIAAVAYDRDTSRLFIMFKSGGSYIYYGVPGQIYADLCAAHSPGRFVSQQIVPFFGFQLADAGLAHLYWNEGKSLATTD